jgi:hypothetical protein
MARPRVGPKLAEETLVRLVRQSELLRIPAADTCSTSWPRPRCVVPDGPGERSCTVFALQRLTSSFPVHNASRPMALGRLRWTCNKLYRSPTRGRRQRMVHQYVRWTSIRVFRLSRGVARRPKNRSCTTEAEKSSSSRARGGAPSARATGGHTGRGLDRNGALAAPFRFLSRPSRGSNAVSRLGIGATHHNRNPHYSA